MKVNLAHGHHRLAVQVVHVKMINNVKICTLVLSCQLLVRSLMTRYKMWKRYQQKKNNFCLWGSVDIGNLLISHCNVKGAK